MPLYTYKCSQCRKSLDRIVPLKEYDSLQYCDCGDLLQKIITPVAIRGDYPGYSCPVTDKWIEGKTAHEENLKRQGCRVYEPGELAQFKRRKSDQEAAFDKSVDSTVSEFIEKLPSEKKHALEREMTAGTDLAYTRSIVQGN